MRGLKDKVAIVAGAAPGNIGGATAIRLAEEGMLVVAADLNEAAAQTVADGITASGGTAVARGFDITDEGSYRDLVTFAVERFGGLHGLHNVAADLSPGAFGRDTDVTSVPLDVWQHTIDVTLTGYMYGMWRSSSPTTAPTSTASRCWPTAAPTSTDPQGARVRFEHAPRRRRTAGGPGCDSSLEFEVEARRGADRLPPSASKPGAPGPGRPGRSSSHA